MTRAEKAKEYFKQGYNCAQSVMLAFADRLGLPEERVAALAKPMGAGLGRLREMCGAVSGGAMCLGLIYSDVERREMYTLVQDFAKRFQAENGSYNCGELLTGAGVRPENLPTPEERTEAYYRKRPCADLVYSAARILEEMTEEN